MRLKISLIAAIMLILPLISHANVESSFKVGNTFTTGTDSQFDVTMTGYQSTNDLISVLNFPDANASDIKSASFLDKSGWVKLTPYQSGSDVLAKFISDTGFDTAEGRTITLRVNFTTPKTYVVGFSLQDASGRVTSSAAAPVVVNGAKILGENIQVNTQFTRSLTYGSRGTDVSALQQKLTAEGFYSGPVTGFFGRLTQTAVRKYQSAHGISPSNGVVGPQTLSALNQ